MHHVVFVAPFFAETTLRFVDALASLPDVRLSLVSQDPPDRVPPAVRANLAGHVRVADALDASAIGPAVRALSQRSGRIDRLLGTLEQLQVPLGELREALGIRGMGAEAARNFRDKARMKSVLRAANLPCARHRLAERTEVAWGFARQVGYPIVVKPPAGAGAQGTFRVDGAESLADCLKLMPPSPARPVLLEEFITGEEHSFDSICVGGRLVWHTINRYFPTPLEVLRQPWIQWCVLSPREVDDPIYTDIVRAAAAALHVLGLETGLSHLEWFRRTDGTIAISEVAARPPGAQFTTLASYACDFDLYRAWAKLMVFGRFEPRSRPYAAGAAFIRGQGQGRVQAIQGLTEANRELGDLVVESRLPRQGQVPSGTYEGDGYVIIRHPETAMVRKALHRLVELIRVELR